MNEQLQQINQRLNDTRAQLAAAHEEYQATAYEVAGGNEDARPRLEQLRQDFDRLAGVEADLEAALRHGRAVEAKAREEELARTKEEARKKALRLTQKALKAREDAARRLVAAVAELGAAYAALNEATSDARSTFVPHIDVARVGAFDRQLSHHTIDYLLVGELGIQGMHHLDEHQFIGAMRGAREMQEQGIDFVTWVRDRNQRVLDVLRDALPDEDAQERAA